jgi:hypothetical protein
MTQPQLDAYLIRCTDLIAKNGWMIQGVFPTQDDPDHMAFSYTVGLSEKNKPELYLDTLGPNQGTAILNACAKAVAGGIVPLHGDTLDVEFSVPFRWHGPIDSDKAEMNMARRFYGEIEAWQVLWPDTEDRYPGDDGYDAERFPQRLMDLA